MLGDYKYEALMKYFQTIEDNKVVLTYDDIENIIGFKLPKSAYEYNAYWRESKTHTVTRAWIESGWKITELRMGKHIEFTKVA
ncbi:hypothetical protein [Clostridium sp.]|uniref:DUF7662 domain-containing protein n=1 Tax=Clostridium sp. TaxID=1506 RepID=UPI002FC5BA2E